MTAAVDYAVQYASLGWRVHPLWPRSKNPVLKEWQKRATTDEEQIFGWWEANAQYNVGVVFGHGSLLVDFECDSKQEEAVFFDLFDNDVPPCPKFRSARGYHFLFRWRPELPAQATLDYRGLKIRLGGGDKGAFSVFPPSIHPSGARYEWVVSPTTCDAPEIPDRVLAKLINQEPETNGNGHARKPAEHWEKVIHGASEGHRNENIASLIGKLLRNSLALNDQDSLAAVYQTVLAVNERNRPPLEEAELKRTFQSILRKESSRRVSHDAESVLSAPIEERVERAAGKGTFGMRLVIVQSDPKIYEIHGPQFRRAPGGCIRLNKTQMVTFSQIRAEALEQAGYPLPAALSKEWNKVGGLYELLVSCAEERESAPEKRRTTAIAARLLASLANPMLLRDNEKPDNLSRVYEDESGSVLFRFTETWDKLSKNGDKITRNELSDLVESLDGEWVYSRKFKKLTLQAMAKLEAMARGEVNERTL